MRMERQKDKHIDKTEKHEWKGERINNERQKDNYMNCEEEIIRQRKEKQEQNAIYIYTYRDR